MTGVKAPDDDPTKNSAPLRTVNAVCTYLPYMATRPTTPLLLGSPSSLFHRREGGHLEAGFGRISRTVIEYEHTGS